MIHRDKKGEKKTHTFVMRPFKSRKKNGEKCNAINKFVTTFQCRKHGRCVFLSFSTEIGVCVVFFYELALLKRQVAI